MSLGFAAGFGLMIVAAISCADRPASAQVVSHGSLPPFSVFKDCDQCPEMVVMPAGSFMMGAVPGESKDPFDIYGPVDAKDFVLRVREPDEINIIPSEHPRHQVEMDIPYAIGRNEVTHAEWMSCVADGECPYVPDHRVLTMTGYRTLGPQHPVINVSYLDVQDYVAWLNRRVGAQVYRLPTEAEWEYAARAGTDTPFAQGDELRSDQANFSRSATENLLKMPRPDIIERKAPVPVNELEAANAWGVRHMSGNVAEITLSCWTDTHLGLATDSAYLAEAEAKSPCRRVGKGGAFNTAMDGLRPAHRFRPEEDYRRAFFGFRLIRELLVQESKQ
ncbi:formylglycine-generating enzyme family protein [Pseudogemmobacter blasticus]|uniref:Sulfatase-modifying factor enzyme-like domain-containing protein n=1 Tax=Fuscovulum blasticum DSM 2131 TaxID=1188250 RepID=A0A2T4J419_FUSBL|nr:formylglycine-generating enzyme family protein [Fuscovulum blasticum]PTE12603.1 hypothetical protein C5F44_17520 [Fuscovulum blasticum DSM 2131]